MAPAVTRDLSVAYGAVTIGGSTDYLIDGPWRLFEDYGRFEFGCEVVINALSTDNEAAFATKCHALEAGFRTIRQAFAVSINGSTYFDANPTPGASGNTGFDAEATCNKIGDEKTDSGRSRRYRVTVTGTLPADLSGVNGRRSSEIIVDRIDSGRRRITIRGLYTALGTLNATAAYEANIASYVTTVLSGFTGTFERVGPEQTKRNETDKSLEFSRTYEEILLRQSLASVDDSSIVNQIVTVDTRDSAPGDSPVDTDVFLDAGSPLVTSGSVRRPVTIILSALMSVDKEVTTDLKAVWTATVRPWLIAHAFNVAGTSFAAIEELVPSFNYSNNTIGASMIALAVRGNILESVCTVKIEDEKGAKPTGVHGTNPLMKHVFQGERFVFRTCHQTVRILKGQIGQGVGPIQGGGGQGQGPAIPAGAGAGAPGSFLTLGGVPLNAPSGSLPFGFGIGAGPPGSAFIIGGAPANGGGGAGAQGGKSYTSKGYGDLNIVAPDPGGAAEWIRRREIQEARPETKGIQGNQIQTIVFDCTVVDELVVTPPKRGGGGSGPITGHKGA